MGVLREHEDAILYLLDYMVGIDEYLDPNETKLFVRHVFSLWPGEFIHARQKINWIAQLWHEHDRSELLHEACALIVEHGNLEADLKLLRQMAAVDGTIEPREQHLFDQICEVLGVAKETLTLDA